jgi:hypothetical protein
MRLLLLFRNSLRRTYASLRFAGGDDPVYVAEQGGWKDPSFPIRVYARAVRRRDRLSGAHNDSSEGPDAVGKTTEEMAI